MLFPYLENKSGVGTSHPVRVEGCLPVSAGAVCEYEPAPSGADAGPRPWVLQAGNR